MRPRDGSKHEVLTQCWAGEKGYNEGKNDSDAAADDCDDDDSDTLSAFAFKTSGRILSITLLACEMSAILR